MLPLPATQVQPLVTELRPQKPHGVTKKAMTFIKCFFSTY